jgi:DNA repair protein SbcC/Rad50
MQVHRLRLVNFRQHEDTDLDFGPGLTGIIGPNGSGKTTLLEALAWALYGTKAARGTVASLRRRSAPPRARVEVELEFSLGPHRYRVARSLHGAELYQDRDPAPIANSASAVTERLVRVLGMTRDEFFHTYFTGQKELAIMTGMGPTDRGRFLSQVLGYERLRTAQDRLREERTVLRARLQEIEGRLPPAEELAREEAAAAERGAGAEARAAAAEAALAAAAAELERLRPAWETLQRLQERVRSLESDLRVAEQRVTNARDTHRALDRDLAEALAAQTRIGELAPRLADHAALTEEHERLQALADRAAQWRVVSGQLAELRRQVAALDRKLAGLPPPEHLEEQRAGLAAAAASLAGAEARAEKVRSDWDRDLQDARTQLKQLTDQYTDFTAQRDRLRDAGPDGVCPTCGRPLGESFSEVMEDLERRTTDVTRNGKFYRSKVRHLEAEPTEVRWAAAERDRWRAEVTRRTEAVTRAEGAAGTREALAAERGAQQERIVALEAQLAGLAGEYDEARHRAVRERLTAMQAVRSEHDRLQGVADRAARLAEEAARAEAELSRHEAATAALRAELKSAGWSEERFAEARKALEAAERVRSEAEREAVEARADLKIAQLGRDAVARRRAERERAVAEAGRVKADFLLNQELDGAFSDLRTDLNTTMRPDLSDLGSRFLRDLTSGRFTEMELDEDYLPRIVEDGEPQAVLSGGEEDVVSLSLRLAISQMIAERAGQPLSLLVLDEIFGSLDEERRSAVLDLLRRLADRFPQVILITHIDSVRDGFDRVVRLDYDLEHGVARVREDAGQGRDVAA